MTFEYGLFGGVNDQLEHARDLAHLIKDLNCHVNLIPVNHVPERNYVKTPKDDIFKFEKELKRLGINATIRREQGSDIDAKMWTIKSEGTTSRNEVITMLNAQFFTDTGQHRNKMKMQEVFFITKPNNSY